VRSEHLPASENPKLVVLSRQPRDELMNYKNSVHFLLVPASFFIGVILISQTAFAKSILSVGHANSLIANENNCLQVGKIAVTDKISLSAVKRAGCSENSGALNSFSLIASTSIYLISENDLTPPTAHPSSTTADQSQFLLHFMIAISIVVLMFRTQIMEWELLRLNRTFDSS